MHAFDHVRPAVAEGESMRGRGKHGGNSQNTGGWWWRGVGVGGRSGRAALTLQSEWVRWRGELMSLGVDDRSPSSAEASEMMEG